MGLSGTRSVERYNLGADCIETHPPTGLILLRHAAVARTAQRTPLPSSLVRVTNFLPSNGRCWQESLLSNGSTCYNMFKPQRELMHVERSGLRGGQWSETGSTCDLGPVQSSGKPHQDIPLQTLFNQVPFLVPNNYLLGVTRIYGYSL
jgi:hypothetical protein